MNRDQDFAEKLAKSLDHISEDLDADVLVYSGAIDLACDYRLKAKIAGNQSRPNVVLFITTPGGSPDVAYRISRYLQATYKKFNSFVSSYCKSAGTLISIGADQIIISDTAELGPLDVQIAKHDELAGYVSGLTPVKALETLRAETFRAFEGYFLDILDRSYGLISTARAAHIATRLTTQCLSPIYQQIDPMRLGEHARAMDITYHYGVRLDRGNLQPEALELLITGYPAHGSSSFVWRRRNCLRTSDHLQQTNKNYLIC